MGITISGNNGTAVNASTDGDLQVNLSMDGDNAGFATLQAEVHDGVTGQNRLIRELDVSPDYRTRVGTDSIFWQDTFAQTSLNLSKYKATEATHTKSIVAGRLTFNTGASLAAGSSVVSTWRTFPIYGSYPTYFECWAYFDQLAQANNVCEFGMAIAAAATTPTDGVFFRLDSAGIFKGVINEGGAETEANLGFTHAAATMYHFLIVIHNDRTEFWIDDILYGVIPTPAGYGSACLTNALPIMMREYNIGATALAQKMQISQVNVTVGDLNTNRLWATMQAGMGNSGIHKPDGAVSAQSANFGTSTAPIVQTLVSSSNSGATYLALGGQFSYNVMNANDNTDYILFEYQVPAASTVQPGRTYILRGMRIQTALMSALCTTNTLIQYGLAVGHSAESLATADSSSAGTRAPRRVALGLQGFTTAQAIGTLANPPELDVNLDAPLMVEAGSYIDLLVKFVAATTGTTLPVFRGTAFYNGYWE